MSETKNKGRSIVIVIIACLVLAIAGMGMWLLHSKNKAEPVDGGKTVTVEVISERDSYNFEEKYTTDEEYLGNFLDKQGLIGFDDTGYGRFITSVQGYASNDAEQAWWSVSVNGEMAMTGIDEIVLEDGSVYTLELKIGW